jgi:hypothetical protein
LDRMDLEIRHCLLILSLQFVLCIQYHQDFLEFLSDLPVQLDQLVLLVQLVQLLQLHQQYHLDPPDQLLLAGQMDPVVQ